MKMARIPVFFLLFFAGLILLLFLIMQPLQVLHFRSHIALLFPKGLIALQERNLLLIIQVIMLLVVLPVYLFTFIFSWRYRFQNKKAHYDPDLVDNRLAEYLWWGVPFVLTVIVSCLTWIKTAELDPYKPLAGEGPPLTIQAVALQWKWLFIYPEEQIASVNFVQFPAKRPIHFEITADAPMNSLWIPDLAGQIYAMPKMKTELNLIADVAGDFRGSSANLSGEGFADMHFITRASSDEEYAKWVLAAKEAPLKLDWDEYAKLASPGTLPPALYNLSESQLFQRIIDKYMLPPG